jgi:hypothetical protein
MSNTNILASVQRERVALTEMVAYLLHKPKGDVDLVADVSTLGDIIVNQSDELGMIDYNGYKTRITELESELAAAIAILRIDAEVYKRLAEMGVRGDLSGRLAHEFITAHDARQSAGQPSAVPAGDSEVTP